MALIKTLTVYLGSSGHARQPFRAAAGRFGHILGAQGLKLAYGGMDAGLMGVLAANALKSGAEVTGIIPRKLQDSERILPGLSKTILVEDLWDRKKRMFLMADAVVSLPGGFGTLDESLEVLYWGHLGLHNKPLVLVNIENYWDPLIKYLYRMPDFDPRFLIVVEQVEEILPALADWNAVPLPATIPEHLPHFEAEITRATSDSILIDQASVENSYYAACALGLKQLARHTRPIGFLNTNGQFDLLLDWFRLAERETFITPKCLKLFAAHENEQMLRAILKNQEIVVIDLHGEKWGPREAG